MHARVTYLIAPLLLVSHVCAQQPAVLTSVYNPDTQAVYRLLNQSSWTAAQLEADALGGNLVTVNSSLEHSFIRSSFSTFGGINRHLWIGLHDPDPFNNSLDRYTRRSEFVWIGDDYSSYSAWSPVEPNNEESGDPIEVVEQYVHIWDPTDYYAGRWNNYVDLSSLFGHPMNGVFEVCPCVAMLRDSDFEFSPVPELPGMMRIRFAPRIDVGVYGDPTDDLVLTLAEAAELCEADHFNFTNRFEVQGATSPVPLPRLYMLHATRSTLADLYIGQIQLDVDPTDGTLSVPSELQGLISVAEIEAVDPDPAIQDQPGPDPSNEQYLPAYTYWDSEPPACWRLRIFTPWIATHGDNRPFYWNEPLANDQQEINGTTYTRFNDHELFFYDIPNIRLAVGQHLLFRTSLTAVGTDGAVVPLPDLGASRRLTLIWRSDAQIVSVDTTCALNEPHLRAGLAMCDAGWHEQAK